MLLEEVLLDFGFARAVFEPDRTAAFVPLFFVLLHEVLLVLGFAESAFLTDGTAALVFVFVVLDGVLFDLGLGESASLADTTAGFAPPFFELLDDALLDLGLAESVFLLSAISDLNFFTSDSAFTSFFLVFDSFAFSFFFFIYSLAPKSRLRGTLTAFQRLICYKRYVFCNTPSTHFTIQTDYNVA